MISRLCFVSSDQLKREDVCNLLEPYGIVVQTADLKIDEIQHVEIEEIVTDKVIRVLRVFLRYQVGGQS